LTSLSLWKAPVEEVDFDAVTASLWAYLDELHPNLRGGGRTWPVSGEATLQLLDDGEVDIALSFNPNEASAAVRSGQLPESVRTYVFDEGTIGNTHFVTIPWNASSAAGAMVVADFLLSPKAQIRKADPEFWGDLVREVLGDPRLRSALSLTVFTGGVASFLVAALTVVILVSAHGTRAWRALIAALPPLLAVPHAALAVGIAFLLAPSGWLVRLVSPTLTGFERPPVDWTIPDAWGISLIAGLVIKETPFLVLACAAQLRGLDVDASLRIGRTLGYSPARCWSRLILPRLWPRIRLVFLAILAFNLAVVDMAILLGPGHPPTLAVWLVQLISDPVTRHSAAVGALLLTLLVAAACASVLLMERLLGFVAVGRRRSGRRSRGSLAARRVGQAIAWSLTVVGVLSLLVLPVWSLASRWRFPDAWLPYVVLILATAWRELDPRWMHASATLGVGYWKTLWRVRLPLLAGPVAQAAAVAVAVSVAQYLPTLLLGAGRQATLATELVAGQGGMDRRSMATLAVLQAVLPLLAFLLALRWQRRQSLRVPVAVVP